MIEHLDVSYGPDERNKIDFYQSAKATESPRPPLLIFIHGGAWRTGSRKDHADMARRLVNLCGGNLTVALVDYRLTLPKPLAKWSDASKPIEYQNRHPAHLIDIYAAMRFLLLTPDEMDNPPDDDSSRKQPTMPERYGYNHERVVLMGHSVGAWLASAVLLDPRSPRWKAGSTSYERYKDYHIPRICDSFWEMKYLTKKINAWILVDGIYDLISLLDEYPDYRSFVAEAFPLDDIQNHGSEADQLRRASVMMWTCLDSEIYCCGDGPIVHLAHSTSDELLSTRQSEEVEEVLDDKFRAWWDERRGEEWVKVKLKKADWGSHDGMLLNHNFLSYVAKIIEEDSDRVAKAEKKGRRGREAYNEHSPDSEQPSSTPTQAQRPTDYDLIGSPPRSRPRRRAGGQRGSRSPEMRTLDLSMAESSPPAQ